MPNWVTNIIKVEKNISEFKKKFIDEDNYFDFHKVIPMPKDLEISSGSYSFRYIENEKVKQIIINNYNTTDTQKEFTDKVLAEVIKENLITSETKEAKQRETDKVINQAQGYFNLQKYGYEDWYEWSINNWGTKWNASDVHISESDALYIIFETAWSMPEEILTEIAKEFDFIGVFADEDLGYNMGTFEAQNGAFFISDFENTSNFFTAVCIKNNTVSDKAYLHELIKDYELTLSEDEIDEVINELTPYLP